MVIGDGEMKEPAEGKVVFTDGSGTGSAYLSWRLPDGTYIGEGKHTGLPVHLRPEGARWFLVCKRTWACVPGSDEWTEVSPTECVCRSYNDGDGS